ncbi:hypothetical protein BH10ACI3_BH10ACI3_08520 [soil metagenome]
MPNEETMTITETAPDGTETVIEVTSTKPDDAAVESDKSIVEEVFEALFDTDEDADYVAEPETDGDPVMYETTPTDDEISTNSVEFNIGGASFSSIDIPPEIVDTADLGYSAVSSDGPAAETNTSEVDAAAADQQAHADAAVDAQAAADDFVAQGDYAAAAEARETAENESYAAGDGSMLGSSDSGDLENAAYRQDNAADYREQQAEHIAAGDFEAAKEDAQNAAYATGDADYQAGGADHTGQSDNDASNLDWAVWDQKNADSAAKDVDYYVAEGDLDSAETAADHVDTYNAAAGDYAGQADPTSVGYEYDASSAVDAGGTYDAGVVDTGFDAGVDTTAAASYDTSTDDV